MLRPINKFKVDDKVFCEIFCLSTDTKPTTGILTGSTATEVDTGDIYMFNEESSAWVKQMSLQA